MAKNRKREHEALCYLLLALLTAGAYLPALSFDFITYDDTYYVTENSRVQAGLTWGGALWAFTHAHAANWHPLTWLSHMLDCGLYALKPAGHHFTNLLFHTANTLLLLVVLKRMTGKLWRSAAVAALFALHPLHVESVAWVSERKDVLSGFFFMLTLWAYVRYAAKPVIGNPCSVISGDAPGVSLTDHRSLNTDYKPRTTLNASLFYFLSLLFFALGLMSKPMLVTVPFVLLLLDFWPLRRLQLSTLNSQLTTVLEKLPFFALSACSCVLTLWAQTSGGAVVPVAVLPLPQRLANAVGAYGSYIAKTLWPVHLAVLYPFGADILAGAVVGSGALLLAVSGIAVGGLRLRPHLAVGWFWFLGMLVPVIGLVQVGMQQMADRYTYLPLIGLFVMLAWEVPEQLGRWRRSRAAIIALAGVTLGACIFATRHQLSFWQDSERLFGRALEVAPTNYIALDNYGRALLKQGKLPEAVQVFTAAVELRPDLDASRCGLGTALMEQGKLGEAAAQFTRVLELQPDHATALLQLGLALGRQGKLTEAAQAFSRALKLRPNDAGAHNNLGNVLAAQDKHEEAVREFEQALRLKPDHAGARNNLALSCAKLGRISEAIAHYREAIRLQPDSIQALNNLAWLLAACPDARFRNGAEALLLATRACELTKYQSPVPLATLAAAYADTGQFTEAVAYAERARELAGAGQTALVKRLSAMLAAYKASQPYHAD